jgi:hypothetical protein
MKTEPLIPEQALQKTRVPATRGRLEGVLDRLALTGYHVDREKWERFEEAGLVATPMPNERGEREAIRRLRRILDVERRLAPTGDTDALCFHLAAAGIENVPSRPVARHIVASVARLFAVGDQLRGAIAFRGSFVGPDGEIRLARAMGKHVLRSYRTNDRGELRLLESLLDAAFIAYVRSTYTNARPAQLLHVSSSLVTSDLFEEKKKPIKHTAEPLPPVADRDNLIGWLTAVSAENELAVLRATQSVAALIRLHVHQFPELQIAWRDVAAECGPNSATSLQALALVPPVLVAAFLQAGHVPPEPIFDRLLERLMHFWGTVSFESVRFDLSNGAFPWVQRITQ